MNFSQQKHAQNKFSKLDIVSIDKQDAHLLIKLVLLCNLTLLHRRHSKSYPLLDIKIWSHEKSHQRKIRGDRSRRTSLGHDCTGVIIIQTLAWNESQTKQQEILKWREHHVYSKQNLPITQFCCAKKVRAGTLGCLRTFNSKIKKLSQAFEKLLAIEVKKKCETCHALWDRRKAKAQPLS